MMSMLAVMATGTSVICPVRPAARQTSVCKGGRDKAHCYWNNVHMKTPKFRDDKASELASDTSHHYLQSCIQTQTWRREQPGF